MAVLGLLLLAMGASACGVAGRAASLSGRDLYGSCASCHGAAGEGNATVGAPRLAGLPSWYVTAQIEKFQTGLRGMHPDDAEGLRMRAMAKQMVSKVEVDAVAGYIAGLAPVATPATLTEADLASGESFFAVCSACHGPKGEGNQQLNAPPIGGLDDWYVARQIRKYQSGVRGRVPGDMNGMQMVGTASTVPAGAVDDVAAYVHALGQ